MVVGGGVLSCLVEVFAFDGVTRFWLGAFAECAFSLVACDASAVAGEDGVSPFTDAVFAAVVASAFVSVVSTHAPIVDSNHTVSLVRCAPHNQ